VPDLCDFGSGDAFAQISDRAAARNKKAPAVSRRGFLALQQSLKFTD
jgi:hypothetical protein